MWIKFLDSHTTRSKNSKRITTGMDQCFRSPVFRIDVCNAVLTFTRLKPPRTSLRFSLRRLTPTNPFSPFSPCNNILPFSLSSHSPPDGRFLTRSYRQCSRMRPSLKHRKTLTVSWSCVTFSLRISQMVRGSLLLQEDQVPRGGWADP